MGRAVGIFVMFSVGLAQLKHDSASSAGEAADSVPSRYCSLHCSGAPTTFLLRHQDMRISGGVVKETKMFLGSRLCDEYLRAAQYLTVGLPAKSSTRQSIAEHRGKGYNGRSGKRLCFCWKTTSGISLRDHVSSGLSCTKLIIGMISSGWPANQGGLGPIPEDISA